MADVITPAWHAHRADVGLTIQLPRGPSMRAVDEAGDLIEVRYGGAAQGLADLTPLLHQRNFDTSSLLSGIIAGYNSNSALLGLPLFIGEVQLYSNSAKLEALGIAAPVRWSLPAMRAALEAAAPKAPPPAPLIAGLGWGDVRIWGTFVLGLGGGFGPSGTFDLSAAAAPTMQLAEFAGEYRWDPSPDQSPTGTSWTFINDGFSHRLADALFAFLAPISVYYPGKAGRIPKSLAALAPQIFPTIGTHAFAPGWSSGGLGVSQYSPHAQAAADVLVWLLEPEQQHTLAMFGWPPVLASLAGTWEGVLGALPLSTPRFSYTAYVDVLEEMGPMAPYHEYDVSSPVFGALQQIAHGADVASEMATLQRELAVAVKA